MIGYSTSAYASALDAMNMKNVLKVNISLFVLNLVKLIFTNVINITVNLFMRMFMV